MVCYVGVGCRGDDPGFTTVLHERMALNLKP